MVLFISGCAGGPNYKKDAAEILSASSSLSDEELRSIKNGNKLSYELFEELSNSSFVRVRGAVATNRWCPQHILLKLSQDSNEYIRGACALHPNLPADVFNKLCNDESSSVRSDCARSRNATPRNLMDLSNDESTNVRTYVAQNNKTPQLILERFVTEGEELQVLEGILKNDNVSKELISKVALNHKPSGATRFQYSFNQVLAANKYCPKAILQKLSDDPNVSVLSGVARNPESTPELLTYIYERLRTEFKETDGSDGLYGTIWQLATNKNTPIEVLKQLAATTSDKDVASALVNNNSSTEEVLNSVISNGSLNSRSRIHAEKKLMQLRKRGK